MKKIITTISICVALLISGCVCKGAKPSEPDASGISDLPAEESDASESGDSGTELEASDSGSEAG